MKLQNHVLVWLRCESRIPLLTRDNTSDTTTGINDMIVGGYASVGTTNLIIQPIKPSERVVILGDCYAW